MVPGCWDVVEGSEQRECAEVLPALGLLLWRWAGCLRAFVHRVGTCADLCRVPLREAEADLSLEGL